MMTQPLRRLALHAASSALLVGLCWIGLRPAVAAEPAFIIDLPDGGSLPGEFVPAAAGDGPRATLPWRAPPFSVPLEFRFDGIVGIRSTAPLGPVDKPEGFNCRLRDGDVIDGELREIDTSHVVLGISGGDVVRVARELVTGIGRRARDAGGGYVGPGGLAGWKQTPNDSWRDEAGRIASDMPNAAVTRDVGGPARARYDVILSWRKQPELTLSVAAGDGKRPDPFRFEVLSVGGALPVAMLVRQERGSGRLEPVPLPDGEPGRLRLTLFVDQPAGRLAAAVEGSEKIIDITLPPDGGRGPSPRFRLQLMSGDVCLERLRVTEWTMAEPRVGNVGVTQIVTRGGGVLEGELVSLAADGKLVVRTADGEQTRSLDEIESVEFAASPEALDPAVARAASVRAVSRGGGVLTGDVVAVADDGLVISRAGIDGPIPVPFVDLHALVSLKPAEPPSLSGRVGTLKMDGAIVPGCLVDAVAWGGGLAWQPRGSIVASPLAGDPADLSAVVEYVAPAAVVAQAGGEVEIGGIGGTVNQEGDGVFVIGMLSDEGAAARDGRIEPGDRIVAVRPVKDGPFVPAARLDVAAMMNLLRGRVGTPVSLRIVKPGAADPEPRQIDLVRGLIMVGPRDLLDEALAEHARFLASQDLPVDLQRGFTSLLVLRSGDALPVKVEHIGAEGVRLRSPITAGSGEEVVTVANELVRAIEFDRSAASSQITRDRFERLTTLPRSQRDDPPTHLLRLRTEDYLRGRLESLDAEQVVFSVLGQRKTLPRAAVARIIWLHPDEIDYAAGGGVAPEPGPEEEDEQEAAAGPAGLLVQGVSPRGRTTLVAERLEGTAIVGESPAFGPSRIDTKQIDTLLLGRAVGAGDEPLPFAQWRLRLAPLPRALRDKD